MKKILLSVAIGSVALLAGCTNSSTLGGNVYSSSQAKEVQSVTYGTITNVRVVQIQANDSGVNAVGTLGGGIIGGLIGNQIGGGGGKDIATAVGALAGIAAGSAIENTVNKKNALEMEIKTDAGQILSVVQAAAANEFFVGQKVRLISNGNSVTVAPR